MLDYKTNEQTNFISAFELEYLLQLTVNILFPVLHAVEYNVRLFTFLSCAITVI